MSEITNLPALTTEQIKSMSETLFEGFFNDPLINSLVTIQQGIKSDKQLVIFERHTGLAGAQVSSCPTPENGVWGFNTIEKTWQPKPIGDRMGDCWTTFQDTCIQWMLNAGVEKTNITGTEVGAFIVDQLQDLIAEVYARHFWFGNKTIVAGTNNNIGAGDVGYFNVINGIWQQAVAIVTADADRLSTGLASRNGQASFALQKFTSTDVTNQVVSNTMDSMWYEADIRMRSVAKNQLRYYVTQSVADQLEKERKAISGIDLPYTRQENGMDTLTWNGIQVVPVQLWDRMLISHFGDDATPVKTTLPHRIILSTPSNLILGVESTSALGELKVWHSEDDEKMYSRFMCGMDAKVGVDNLIQVAY
jgi:hypothetical protein